MSYGENALICHHECADLPYSPGPRVLGAGHLRSDQVLNTSQQPRSQQGGCSSLSHSTAEAAVTRSPCDAHSRSTHAVGQRWETAGCERLSQRSAVRPRSRRSRSTNGAAQLGPGPRGGPQPLTRPRRSSRTSFVAHHRAPCVQEVPSPSGSDHPPVGVEADGHRGGQPPSCTLVARCGAGAQSCRGPGFRAASER